MCFVSTVALACVSLIVNVVVIFGTTLLSTLSLPSAYTVYVPASRFLIRSGSPSPLVVAVTASIDNAPLSLQMHY